VEAVASRDAMSGNEPNRQPPAGRDFHAEHEQILRDVEWMRMMAGRVPSLSLEQRQELIEGTIERLRRIGLHTAAEERLFYPVLSRLLGTPRIGDAMVADHQYVRARMQYLAEIDPASTAALQAILYGLHGVITTHIEKVDGVLAPLIDQLRETSKRDD
jgi:hypothetical protein